MTVLGVCRRPQSECPIHVDPCPMMVRYRNQRSKIVKRPGMKVAGLKHDNRRGDGMAVAKQLLQNTFRNTALRICRDINDACGAQPEESNGAFDGSVTLIIGEDADRRSAVEAVAFYIP